MPQTEPKIRKNKLERAVEAHIGGLSLGRGPVVDDIFPTHTVESQQVRDALKRNRLYGDLPLTVIQPDPDQVRKIKTDTADFEELVSSIQQHGVLQPIQVRWRETEQVFQIIAGERRFAAAQRAALETIPVVLKDVDDTQKAIHQLVENLQRENLNPIEEAKAFQRYLVASGETHEILARKIGKDRTYVTKTLSLLEELDREEQATLAECAPANMPGKTLIFEALRIPDRQIRQSILRGEVTREEARQTAQQFKKRTVGGRPKNTLRRFSQPGNPVRITVSYPETGTTTEQIVAALDQARKEVAG